jgi:hypothetical protein
MITEVERVVAIKPCGPQTFLYSSSTQCQYSDMQVSQQSFSPM